MCGVPVEMLTAVPVLASALAPEAPGDAVIVAPDLGAVKLAEHYASLLARPVAVVRKTRLTGATVHAEEIAGEVADRPAIIVDDMISTGATSRPPPGLSSLTAAARHRRRRDPRAAGRRGGPAAQGAAGTAIGHHRQPAAGPSAALALQVEPSPRCWPTPSAACTTTSRWQACWPAPDQRLRQRVCRAGPGRTGRPGSAVADRDPAALCLGVGHREGDLQDALVVAGREVPGIRPFRAA